MSSVGGPEIRPALWHEQLLVVRAGDVATMRLRAVVRVCCAGRMNSSAPTPEYTADGQELDDATRIAELRAALLDAQRWLMYAAGREVADEPGQAAFLLQASADIEATLERTATSCPSPS